MTIVHDQEKSRFALYDAAGVAVGELEYHREGDSLYADHTGVRPDYEGQGLAGRLLGALAAYAEREGLRIIPVCPYVTRAFEKYPERYSAVM
jgi:predicted GNAT family acetyltransferase